MVLAKPLPATGAQRMVLAKPLPATGVRDADGTLIYHRTRAAPGRSVVERMKQCGVEIRKGQFLEEEDKILLKNWSMFAQKYGLDDEAAYEYAGGYSYEKIRNGEWKSHLKKLSDTQFVPNMCRGLDHRTGYQVIWRLYYLSRPRDRTLSIFKNRKVVNKWTPERVETLKNFVKLGFNPGQIQREMRIGRDSVQYFMRKLGLNETCDESNCDLPPLREMTANERAYFFRQIIRTAEKKDLRYYPSLSEMLELFESKKEIDYALVCMNMTSMHMTASQAKRYWLHEGERLKKTYEECGGDMKQVSERYNLPSRRMNAEEWQRTLALIREQNPMNNRDINKDLVHQRMIEEGLTGFYTSGTQEGYYAVDRFMNFRGRYSCYLENDIPVIRQLSCKDFIDVLIEYSKATHWKFHNEIRRVKEGNKDKLKALVIERLQAAGISVEQIPNYKELLARGNARTLPYFSEEEDDDMSDCKLQDAATVNCNQSHRTIQNDNEIADHRAIPKERMTNDGDGVFEDTSSNCDVVEIDTKMGIYDRTMEISKKQVKEQQNDQESAIEKQNNKRSKFDLNDGKRMKRKYSNHLEDNNENDVSIGENDNEFGKDEDICADVKRKKKKREEEKRNRKDISDHHSQQTTSSDFIENECSVEKENSVENDRKCIAEEQNTAKKPKRNNEEHSKNGELGENVVSEGEFGENERKRLKKLRRHEKKRLEARQMVSLCVEESSFVVANENAELTNKQHKKSKRHNHDHISDCDIEQPFAAVTVKGDCIEKCRGASKEAKEIDKQKRKRLRKMREESKQFTQQNSNNESLKMDINDRNSNDGKLNVAVMRNKGRESKSLEGDITREDKLEYEQKKNQINQLKEKLEKKLRKAERKGHEDEVMRIEKLLKEYRKFMRRLNSLQELD